MAKSAGLNDSQHKTLNMAREEWNQARKDGAIIMQIRDPVGNPEAGEQMEQFDRVIDSAIDILSVLYASIFQQTQESYKELQEIESRAQLFVLVLSVVAFTSSRFRQSLAGKGLLSSPS
jgi:hypothetical protein